MERRQSPDLQPFAGTPRQAGCASRDALGLIGIRSVAPRCAPLTAYCFVWASVLLSGCAPPAPNAAPQAGAGALRGWNVLLISSDTTRPDHLGCYGAKAARTPNIDALARFGVLIEQCMTSAPLTLPAHASLLTGLYPFTHGARDNGQFYVPSACVSMAETLSDAGYATAAQIGAYVLNREYGLAQGFSTYGDIDAIRRPQAAGGGSSERSAEQVADAALAWLDSHAGPAPFFLFVHFYDPHTPYAPPKRFADSSSAYAGEIAYVDEQVGRLMRRLAERGVEERTLVVFTSDHGDGLGDHEESTHGYFVYDSTMHVPLLLRAPGVLPAGRRVAGQTRITDIAPTMVDLLGLALPAAIDGATLTGAIFGAAAPPRVAYGETFYPHFALGYSWYRCLRQDEWKYIHGPIPELYHLAADPRELTNLAEQQPARLSEMRAALRSMLAEVRPISEGAPATRAVGAEERRALESLGYLSSGGAEAALAGGELERFDPLGPPAREHAEENRVMGRILTLLGARRADEAVALLQPLVAESARRETFWWGHATLGEAQELRGDDAAAAQAYADALKIRPRDGRTRARLAAALTRIGRLAQALPEFERALQDPPTFAETHYDYGVALAEAGRQDEALRQQRAATALDPRMGRAHAEIGRLLAAAGRGQESLRAYQDAVAAAPGAIGLRHLLAAAQSEQRRYGEAIATLRDALAEFPDDAATRVELAWLLVAAPGEASDAHAGIKVLHGLAPMKDLDQELRRLEVLAAAAAANERFDEAVRHVDDAILKARQAQRNRTLADLLARRDNYRAGGKVVLPAP